MVWEEAEVGKMGARRGEGYGLGDLRRFGVTTFCIRSRKCSLFNKRAMKS